MNGAIAWMVRNGVAANLLMVFIIVAGLSAGFTIIQEAFPEFSLGSIQISVAYPGASPEEIEESIVQRIEDQIEAVDGIKNINSVAAENLGTVSVELNRGVDAQQMLDEIKSEIDRITTFPDEAEEPEIREQTNLSRSVQFVLYGDVPERTLKELANQTKDLLTTIEGVSYVTVDGVRNYEVSINVSQATLRAHNLTLLEIADQVRRNSLDLPGGDIETRDESILLRTRGRNYSGADFADIIVRNYRDGAQLKLGDIADIDDGFEDSDLISRYNGLPAAYVNVYRVGDEKILDVVARAKQYVEQELRPSLPAGIDVAIWNDSSNIYKSRAGLLVRNGAIGLLLVIITLALFLDVQLAFWTAVGIFVSFVGAIAVLHVTGFSINMITLFGFILAIGIVVDDAIVTGENIFAEHERGQNPMHAAIRGTERIAKPVSFAVFTTVCAFIPLFFAPGMLGNMFAGIAAVIVAVLLLSLVESLLVLPYHLSHLSTHPGGMFGLARRLLRPFEARTDRVLAWFVEGPLDRALRFCTRHHALTVIAAVCLIPVSAGIFNSGIASFTFFPEIEGETVTASIELHEGATARATARVADAVYRAGLAAAEELQSRLDFDEPAVIQGSNLSVGTQMSGQPNPRGGEDTGAAQANIASVNLLLPEPELRSYPAAEFERLWRARVGDFPEIKTLSFAADLVSFGSPVDIRISGPDNVAVESAVAQLKAELAGIAGVYDIQDDSSQGKQELNLQLKPAARNYDLTLEEVAMQVRGAFFGVEALRVQRGRDEVRVYVRLPDDERDARSDLLSYRIRTRNGAFIPLDEVAEVEIAASPVSIRRQNGQRIVSVTANVNSAVVTGREVNDFLSRDVLPALQSRTLGLSYSFGGEEQDLRETISGLSQSFVLALFAIYALLAIEFRSYLQPLVIMAAIPFGFVGALIGHVIMGYSVSLLSVFGVIGLSGIVINDSLVMIDFINERQRAGVPVRQAIIDGAKARFRPIILTSITTFFGVSPLIVERSLQAQFLVPMAISIGFGVLFATFVLMLLVPALCMFRFAHTRTGPED